MDPSQLLARVRPYILHVDPSGTIRAAAGGYLGVLDCDNDAMVGHSVLDYLPADDHHTIASYFLDSAESADTAPPAPFRATMVASDGRPIPVEVIAMALPGQPRCDGWVMTVVPHESMSIPVQPLEALINNRPLPEVLALIADKPSKLVKRYIAERRLFWSCEPDEAHLAYAAQSVGSDALLFASDYPHWDCTFPGAVAKLAQRSDLDEVTKEKLLHGNASEFYRLK